MLTDKTATFIGRTLAHLEHLSISFCNHLTDTALHGFSGLRHLSSLRLRKGTNFTCHGFEVLFGNQQHHTTHQTTTTMKRNSNGCADRNYVLHTLDLSECQELSDSNLLLIATKLPNLRKLEIAWCFKITDTGLAALTERCKLLTTLKLIGLKYAHCEPLFLAPLAKLVSLDLSQTDLVDDTKLFQLKRERPWLKIINYYGEEIVSEED